MDAVYVLWCSDIYKNSSFSWALIPPQSSLITHKNEGDGVVTLSILWLNSEMASLAWDSHYSQSDTNRWVREQSVSGEPGLMGRPQQQLQSGWWRAFSLLCRVVRVCVWVCGPLWQLWMSFCEQTNRGHLALSQNAFQYISSPVSPPFIIRDGSTVRAHWEPVQQPLILALKHMMLMALTGAVLSI